MVLTQFRVRIANIRCTDLPQPSAGKSTNAYCKLDFDHFKTHETKVKPKDAEPKWPDDITFSYSTKYPDCLSRKVFSIEVLDYNRFSAVETIGVAKIDLHTLATGCVAHSLPLRDGRKARGMVHFDLEMEQISTVEIQLKKVRLQGLSPTASSQAVVSCLLKVGAGGTSSKATSIISSPGHGASTTAWEPQESVFMEGGLRTVMSSKIAITINDGSPGGKQLGIGAIKMDTFFTFVPQKPVEFDLVLTHEESISGRELPVGAKLRLSGQIVYNGFPVFCQMSSGCHTDIGIIDAAFPFPSIPMRPTCHVQLLDGAKPLTATPGAGAGEGPAGAPDASGDKTFVLPSLRKVSSKVIGSGIDAAVTLPPPEVQVVPLTEPLYKPGENTAPSISNRLFAGSPGMPVCWIRRLDPKNRPGTVTFENLTTNRVEMELPTDAEYVVTVPPSASGALGIAFEPNFSGVQRYGWRSGRRNSGYDCGAVVRSVREGSYAATNVPRLRQGHHLVSVNGQSTLPMTFEATMGLLKVTGRPMVLRFHDPYAVGAAAATLASNPNTLDIPGTVVGSQLTAAAAAAAPSNENANKDPNAAADANSAGVAGSVGTQVALNAPGLHAGATSTSQAPPKKVAQAAAKTLEMALEALSKVDLHTPLMQARDPSTCDPDTIEQAKAVQKAMADPGFIRSLNTIVTGVPRDTLPQDVADAVLATKKKDASDADEELGGDAAAAGPKEAPLTEDGCAEKALDVLATIVATTDYDLALDQKPAYTAGVREQLKERALRMSSVGVFKRAIDSVSARNNPRYASNAVKTVSTIMRVYDLGPKELGLDQSALITLQSQLRKADFGPMTAETHKLVKVLAEENPDQNGLAFIEACIKAANLINAMSSAGYRRLKDSATGKLIYTQPNGQAPTDSSPKTVTDAMEALLDVDRRGRLLDDAAIVSGPEHLFHDIRRALEAQIGDPYVCCVLVATCAKLSAHPINANFCVSCELLPVCVQVAMKHGEHARAAEGAAATLFNVGRDLENSDKILGVGGASRCVMIAKQWINHKTNAGGAPAPWPPQGHEAEVEEGVVFTGGEKYARDRNAVRARLVRVSINVLINLACYRQRGPDGSTSVEQIARAGGVQLLGECLRIHTSEALVVTSALNCAANIAFKNREIQLALGERITDAVVLAGYQFTKDNALLSMALRTIGNLTNQDENIYRSLGYGVVRMMSQAMEINPTNVPLQNLAASVMSNIASVEPVDDMTADSCKVLINSARNARVAHPREILRPTPQDAEVSGKLLASGKPVWSVAEWLVLEEDGPKALITSMTNHSTDVALVEACLRTLQCIANDEEVCAQMALRLEAVNKVLFVMRAADFDIGVQLAGATLLQSFATNPACASLVLNSDAAHLLASAADTHKSALVNGVMQAINTITAAPTTDDPDAMLNNLESALEASKAGQVLQLMLRVFETLQLLAGPRASKSVLELNTVSITLQVVQSLLSLLNTMTRKGFDVNIPPTFDPLLQSLLSTVHGGCVLLSVWAGGPPPHLANQAGWEDVSTLRYNVTSSERTYASLARFAELCTVGTGQPGDPSVPAVQLKAARAVVDAIASCLIVSNVLPGRTSQENPPKSGVRTLADRRSVEALVRSGGIKTAGSMMLAHATAAVSSGAQSPVPDVNALTCRMLTSQLLLILDMLACYTAPTLTAASAATAGSNPEVAAQLAADPVANAVGMCSAAASALQTVVADPIVPQLDVTPSPCKLIDLTDLATRVAGHLNTHFSAPEIGSGSVVTETEAAAIFCYSISRAASQITNAGHRTVNTNVVLAAPPQGAPGAMPPSSMAAAPPMPPMPPLGQPMQVSQSPSQAPPPPLTSPQPPKAARPSIAAGIQGNMVPSSPVSPGLRQPSMAVGAPMIANPRTGRVSVTKASPGGPRSSLGSPAGGAGGGRPSMSSPGGTASAAGSPTMPKLLSSRSLKRAGSSRRGFLGRLATEAGIAAAAWVDGKAKPVILKASADLSAILVFEPTKSAKKQVSKSIAPGAPAPPISSDDLQLFERLTVDDFNDVRVGAVMEDGKMKKQTGLFKSGPKVQQCLCFDQSGDTVLQLEFGDAAEAEEVKTIVMQLVNSQT